MSGGLSCRTYFCAQYAVNISKLICQNCDKHRSEKKFRKGVDILRDMWYYIRVAARAGHERGCEKRSKHEENVTGVTGDGV